MSDTGRTLSKSKSNEFSSFLRSVLSSAALRLSLINCRHRSQISGKFSFIFFSSFQAGGVWFLWEDKYLILKPQKKIIALLVIKKYICMLHLKVHHDSHNTFIKSTLRRN